MKAPKERRGHVVRKAAFVFQEERTEERCRKLRRVRPRGIYFRNRSNAKARCERQKPRHSFRAECFRCIRSRCGERQKVELQGLCGSERECIQCRERHSDCLNRHQCRVHGAALQRRQGRIIRCSARMTVRLRRVWNRQPCAAHRYPRFHCRNTACPQCRLPKVCEPRRERNAPRMKGKECPEVQAPYPRRPEEPWRFG